MDVAVESESPELLDAASVTSLTDSIEMDTTSGSWDWHKESDSDDGLPGNDTLMDELDEINHTELERQTFALRTSFLSFQSVTVLMW